ncbi:MAG TPA: DinB family protein [Pyrinomonadaceae bacterium]
MNQASNDQPLRDHLFYLLRGEGAHISFEDLIADFPVEECGERIDGLPYTAWQVLEHMRIAQWDILEFSRDGKHVSPKWPEGYWPAPDDAGNEALWHQSAAKFCDDLKQMEALIGDPSRDLFAKIPHGSGQTILREALLVADHNAYHLGALAIMSRTLKGLSR